MGEGKRSNWKSTETTAMERYFSTDVLVDILQRLPPSSRRRARLVCRVWRDVVDECTTEMQSRAKPLLWHTGNAVAYVVDDPSSAAASARSCRQLWRSAGKGRNSEAVQLVGTCNGLLCLCDDEERVGGALTVINPTTGAKLPIPPLPCTGPLVGHHTTEKWSETKAWHEAYCFAYHPTTGKHKVVHVPCSYERVREFDVVHVLTLGETAWREVSAGPGGAKCNLAAGIVSVDGKTYWIWVTASGVAKVASFDLDDEHIVVSATARPPSLPTGHNSYHLTEVRGRLGFVTRGHASAQAWVLEEEGQRWSRRYILEQRVPLPHFAYAGECVLTVRNGASFYAHRRKDAASSGRRLRCDEDGGVVRVGHEDEGRLVVNMEGYVGDYYRTFAYVKTMEPL